MVLSAVLFASLAFAESKALAVQICLDRAGYSCNTIDGQWGRKSERALAGYLADRTKDLKPALRNMTPEEAYDLHFSGCRDLFRIETVTQADIDALVSIPDDPAAKSQLPKMGYESIKEMFAERGHLSVSAMERINPGVAWDRIKPGLKLVIPDFPPIEEELAAGDRARKNAPRRPVAALVRVSIGAQEITVYDAQGRRLALFPCSIAQNKAKVPPNGELKVASYVEWPNYTYTPDFTPPGEKIKRYVWPEGPNCPVGVAWLGLSLPGYGIHGTPRPESIGFTGSHGCFRLANWNAARLYAMCRPGTRVIVGP